MPETEYKFTVHPSFIVPEMEGHAGVTATATLPVQHLRSTYFDTADLRLARAGATLRHRRGGSEEPIWTLKLPSAGTRALVREEIDLSHADGETPPDDAVDLTLAFHRGAPLTAVATLQTTRRRWSLRGDGGEELAEIADDDVAIIENDRTMARFHEMELEARGAHDEALAAIAKVLRASGAMPSEPIPKAVRALGPRATAPADAVPPPDLAEHLPASAMVKAALARGVGRLIAHDPATRLGDPEGVHQMRVAARRLRSDLKTFGDLVDASWAAEMSDSLRSLGRALGAVRDIDVMRGRYATLAPDLRDELGPLFAALDEREAAARSAMLDALRGEAYTGLLDRLLVAAREPNLTELAVEPAGEIGPGLVRPAWLRLLRDGEELTRSSPPQAFHDVRVRTKRVRYAAEAVGPALGRRSKVALRFASRLARLQDLLGTYQDAHVSIAIVSEVASTTTDGATAIASGRLIEREHEAATAARKAWRKAWRSVTEKEVTSWMKSP